MSSLQEGQKPQQSGATQHCGHQIWGQASGLPGPSAPGPALPCPWHVPAPRQRSSSSPGARAVMGRVQGPHSSSSPGARSGSGTDRRRPMGLSGMGE